MHYANEYSLQSFFAKEMKKTSEHGTFILQKSERSALSASDSTLYVFVVMQLFTVITCDRTSIQISSDRRLLSFGEIMIL